MFSINSLVVLESASRERASLSHASLLSRSSGLLLPSLYIQCAAMPYSAALCISGVLICTSNGIPMPSFENSVVCRERYMLVLGIAI